MRDMFCASFKSSTGDFAGVQNGYLVNDDGTKANSIQELERITKEIETMRHEVEQERRRLSRYQTVQADCVNFSMSKSGKNTERGPYELSACIDLTKTYPQAKKYVVDNSKPRTDLEYDPLSNFSAGLWSYSSGKDENVKNDHGLKRTRSSVSCDQKKPVACPTQLSQLPSPEALDDWNENGALIIDVPPSPDKKRVKAQKPVDSVVGKSFQEKVEVLDEAPILPVNANAGKIPNTAPTVEGNIKRAENNHGPLDFHKNKECENIPVNGSVVDLTACSEDVQSETYFQDETEVEKSPERSSPSATTDHNRNSLVLEKVENVCQIELPHSVTKINPVQPRNLPSQNSFSYKASDLTCKQHTKLETAVQPAQIEVAATCVPSVLPHSQKALSKMSGPVQSKATAPESYLEPAEPGSGSGQVQTLHDSLESCLANRAESSASAEDLHITENNEDVILISSSSGDEDELNYSEMDLSDSDPMEECYRIFMEANDEGNKAQPEESVGAMDVEKPKLTTKPQTQTLLGKKRVAHEAKHIEQPVAKSRPQPQVLVPLRGPAVSGFASQPSITSKIQKVQQRASMVTASVKGGQAFVSSAFQRKAETLSAPLASTQTPENLQPTLVQNAYMNCISLGTAVIGVDNNLHLILPEGTFPLPCTSSSSQVTSVLTPISQVQTSSVAVRQMYHPRAVPPVQRYRTTAPVLISAPARKHSLTSAISSAHSSSAASIPAASTPPQAVVHTAVKPVPTKRKLKQKCESAKDKVPHDIRQRYVNMFTEEFLKATADVNDAFEKALAEEKSVYNRSVNKLKYLSVAVNALKKLKNQSAAAAKGDNQVNSQKSKGNISLNPKKFKADDMALYESLKDYILTEERLAENNYPVQHPEKPGSVVLFVDNKKSSADPFKRICCRCGATYSVNQMGKHIRKEECNYHYGKGVTKKVPGGVETRYSCCEGVMGAPGCQAFHLHVHDSLSLDGFVSTSPRHPSNTSCPGVYSLDCEMCYTIRGLELSRVTVVNSSLQVIYDTFVRPDSEVIDYNTRFSGISEEDVKGIRVSLREVQETLLSFISTDTIVIGHGLEADLCALKLLHGMVVDTSVVFPHRLGPPYKLTLKHLTAEYLRRIIQESVCGHDTSEDAAASMELMIWKVKEDGKLRK